MYISYDQNFISLHCTTYLLELFRKGHFFDKFNKNVTNTGKAEFFFSSLIFISMTHVTIMTLRCIVTETQTDRHTHTHTHTHTYLHTYTHTHIDTYT